MDKNHLRYFVVGALDTKTTESIQFLVQAIDENNALDGVLRCLEEGILPPYSSHGMYTIAMQNAGVASLRPLLARKFFCQELECEPTVLVFPNPMDAKVWRRYQLSWYGRLWQDIRQVVKDLRSWWAGCYRGDGDISGEMFQ